MNYNRDTAKAHAQSNMTGIWAAALTPFKASGALDEDGFAHNIEHWTGTLGIDGLFISGKQGEFFSMSVDERKRTFEIAVEAKCAGAQTIMSCSDQNLDTVLELARHAQTIGADYIVVHAPVLNFVTDRDEVIFRYFKYLSDRLDIGIAMWSHPDSGYVMSPELCSRCADLPNIVAIKYSVDRALYVKLTQIAGDRLIVSTASEDEWFDNIVELGWRLYLCSSPPYLIQSANDRRMREYTDLAFAGKVDEARAVRDSLAPVRAALKSTRPGAKPHAHQKYWQDLLGQVGGSVRAPMLALTEGERAKARTAFESCGLQL